MRSFADLDRTLAQVPAEVVRHLRTIDTGAGTEQLYAHQAPARLSELAHRARIESVTASSEIEGVTVPDAGRARRIIEGRVTTLRTRDEEQLAGYRAALDHLFQDDWRPLTLGLVLHVHRLLWSYTASPGGQLKSSDNLVVDRAPDGSVTVRFRPVPADRTEFHLHELVERYVAARADDRHHPVLLVGLFVLDLLVVHPFEDGNGRVARALATALLSDAGYGVGRWVSVEQLIAQRADGYYGALLASTHGWHDDEADPWPWLAYFTGVLADAYRLFAARAAGATRTRLTKQQRVSMWILEQAPVFFTVDEARTAVPGVSDQTIRLVLNALRDAGRIEADGPGRSARWRRLG